MPLLKDGAAKEWMTINQIRHIVVWVSRYTECTVFSTACGETFDNVRDRIVGRHETNCPTCIPFGRTQ